MKIYFFSFSEVFIGDFGWWTLLGNLDKRFTMYSLGSAEMLDFFGDVFGAASGCGGRFAIGWDSF